MEVVLILVVTGVIILAIKIAMTSPKESSNIQNRINPILRDRRKK